jgi:hypothetical protein
MVRFGDIWEVLKVMAKAGGLAAIHSEDNDIVMHMYEKLIREDRTGFENLAEVHNTLSEDLSFNRVIRLASNVEGAALYMMHTSAATGVRAIAAARANGVPIYGETLHQYLMYSADGVMVSTPTGSTGYNFSAGGPVVEATVPVMILTPVAPHFTIDRSIVVADDKVIRLVAEDKPALIVADGQGIGTLEPGQFVEVRKSPTPVRVVATRSFDLAFRLHESLREGHA